MVIFFNFWINLLFCKDFFEVIWKKTVSWTVHLPLACARVLLIRQKWGSRLSFSQPSFSVRPDCCLGSLCSPCTETRGGGTPFLHSWRIGHWHLWGRVSSTIHVPLACCPLPPVGEQRWGTQSASVIIKELVPSAVNKYQLGWPTLWLYLAVGVVWLLSLVLLISEWSVSWGNGRVTGDNRSGLWLGRWLPSSGLSTDSVLPLCCQRDLTFWLWFAGWCKMFICFLISLCSAPGNVYPHVQVVG